MPVDQSMELERQQSLIQDHLTHCLDPECCGEPPDGFYPDRDAYRERYFDDYGYYPEDDNTLDEYIEEEAS